MENTSYALHIAVGVLIGIVILSIVIFGWRKIGGLESSKDNAVAVKNKADFNAEFEAYNKNLMYGTDVLSCLNKAQSNNQKYVYNNYYGTDLATIGKEDREEFFIDVQVEIKNSPLYDEVKAYYKDRAGKYHRAIGLDIANSIVKANYGDKVFNSNQNAFKSPTVYYYYFKGGKVYQETGNYVDIMWNPGSKNKKLYEILDSGKIETKVTPGIYNLLTNEDTTSVSNLTETAKLAALISTVSLKSQELTNNETPSSFDKTDWWYCTWTTSASDFKTRKFKCIGVEYDEDNGYATKISFEEVVN